MPQRTASTVASPTGAPRLPMELCSIEHAGRIFSLSHPVSVTVESNKDMWVLECASLRILAGGESREKALASFSEDFAGLYDHIATAPDADLSTDARQLKARMRKLVAAVRM